MLCLSGFELYFRWVPLFGHSLIAVVFVLAKPPKYSLRNNICQFNEGGVRGVRKPQNRTEIRQKTANRIGFFPEYLNRAYM